jgi:hypothetical protein
MEGIPNIEVNIGHTAVGFRCRTQLSKLKVRAIPFTSTPFIELYPQYKSCNLTLCCRIGVQKLTQAIK